MEDERTGKIKGPTQPQFNPAPFPTSEQLAKARTQTKPGKKEKKSTSADVE